MPIRDVAAMNKSLDNDYGSSAGSNAPASHEVALFFGDPLVDVSDGGGVELDATDCPGYARVTVAQGVWAAASDGEKTVTVTFPDPTGEWATAATHWGLYGADGNWWDCGELVEPLEVTGAGDGPQLVVTVFYDDSLGLDL